MNCLTPDQGDHGETFNSRNMRNMRNSDPTFSYEFSYVNFTDIYFSFKISIMPGYQLTIFQLGKLRKMTSKYFIAVTPKYFHNKLPVLMCSFQYNYVPTAVEGWGAGSHLPC